MKYFNHLAVKHIVALLFFSILAIVATYPSIRNLNTHIIGDGGDNVEYYAYLHIARDNILQMKYPWAYTYVYRYPYGFDFGLGSDAKAFVLLGGILSTFVQAPVIFNLLVISIFAANGFVSYLFFRSLTNSYALGIIGGIAYGYSYYAMTRGHAYINLLQIYGFPLLGLLILRVVRSKVIYNWDIIAALLIFFVISSSSALYLMFTVVTIIIVIPWLCAWWIIYRPRLLVHVGGYVFFSVICVVLLSWLVMFLPMVKGVIEGKADAFITSKSYPLAFSFFSNEYYRPIFDTSAFLPNFLSKNEPIDLDSGNYIGLVEIFLFIGYVFSLHRSRKELTKKIFFVSFTVFLWWLSLGVGNSAVVLPMIFLKNILPFNLIQSPHRLFVVYHLMMISGVMLYLREHKNKLFYVIIAIIIILERVNMQYPLTDLHARGARNQYTQILRQLPGEGVLTLPLFSGHTSYYNLLPFYSGKNLIDGYFHRLAEGPLQNVVTDRKELLLFRCDSEHATFRYDQIDANDFYDYKLIFPFNTSILVINKDLLDRDDCRSVRENMVAVMGIFSLEEAHISEHDYEKSMVYWREHRDSLKLRKVYDDEDVYIYVHQ